MNRIPSLDGLRACSIILVILAHSSWYLPRQIAQNPFFHLIVGNGSPGVAVFFVISGYLITNLLLKEVDRTGTIKLRAFYFRRTLRIFPAFYAFLGFMAILWALRLINEHAPSFIAAATYLWAYYPGAHGYFIAHTWSLSIEEQFYLLWPVMLLLAYRRGAQITVALLFIVIMPFLRVALYFMAPSLRGHEGYMLQGWIDTMMVGSALSILERDKRWNYWRSKYLNGLAAGIAASVAFLGVPWMLSNLHGRSAGFYFLFLSFGARALGIALILCYVVTAPTSWVGRLLNGNAIRHIGRVSYSLYLWQQLFISPELKLLPFGFLLALAAAELSFYLIESPALRLRSFVEKRWQMQTAIQAGGKAIKESEFTAMTRTTPPAQAERPH